MPPITADDFLPVELIFSPNWWHQTVGIAFDRAFYLDAQRRIDDDMTMRRLLWERYGELGLGEADPRPRPIIGSLHVAGGFVIPALLGAEVIFAPDAAPQPAPMHLTAEEIGVVEKPDFREVWPMRELVADMEMMEATFGFLVGDVNTDGLLNAAYHMYGQALFVDFSEAPERVRRLLDLIGELIVDVASYVRHRTGTYSVSVNRMVAHLDPNPFLHGNCSVQMISPETYRHVQLPVEKRMAEQLQPYGIHHCGSNMHLVASEYARLPVSFYDVGWGSDVKRCRELLPDAFLSLRLSPVRMLRCTPQAIARDTDQLLRASGPLEQAGVCCINMDYGTPDENIFAMFDVVQRYRRYGA